MILLLPLPEPELFELTGTGVALWDVLADPVTIAEAATRLAQLFGAAPERVAEDITGVMGELVRRQVVQEIEAT